jgi:hypothetical protein
MVCLDSIASSFVTTVWTEVFAHFHTVSIKHHSSMRNCLACQDESFVKNPLDVKTKQKKYENALDFAFHMPHLSRSC